MRDSAPPASPASHALHGLLEAVRRHLWRGHLAAALRLAAWAAAGLMLLAAALHLAVQAVPVMALAAALAALCAAAVMRAAMRRPADPACALWADRHLGGASAYTTMLDLRRDAPASTDPQALHWLERWAGARVPGSLQLLAARSEPARLARPLLALLVCAALTAVVLVLPGRAPSPRAQAEAGAASAAITAASTADRPSPVVDAQAASALVAEVASALKSASTTPEPARRDAGPGQAADDGKPADGTGFQATAPATAPTRERAADAAAPAGAATDAPAAAGQAQSAGTGGGREAGDSRDLRADVGVSRALQGTMAVQRSGPALAGLPSERRADSEQSARYDEALGLRADAAAATGPAPAAAAPAASAETARLSATETSYVQAWMKASRQGR